MNAGDFQAHASSLITGGKVRAMEWFDCCEIVETDQLSSCFSQAQT